MSDKLLKVDIQKELKEFNLEMDFELKQGCLGILGPSGCGKSMTLKSIAGIVDPDSGFISLNTGEETVYYDSNKKTNLKPQKRNVGYLFQNYALFPNMTVEENVAVGLGENQDKKIVSEMIERFHLQGLEKRYPRQLSGGQQQRVAVARAIIKPSKIVLADEPTGSLDIKNRNEIFKLLVKLNNKGKTIVIVTHDIELAQKCPRVVVLSNKE